MKHGRTLSFGEEIANSVTHGAGLVAFAIGLPILVATAAERGDELQVLGCSVFASCLVLLYAASTIYHALPQSRAKQIFRVADHIAIYLVIAGSYTPFLLGVLRGPFGWTLCAVIWGLAALGILHKLLLGMRFPHLSTAFYLAMGWLAVVAIGPITNHVPSDGLAWLAAGGLLYTAGVVFYAWERLRYGHMVWHLFVLAGSACHFVAVLNYATV
ncbi:MAG: hemolysin-like protein [Deltaproteobacteria bacterium]|nr:hemolysin-like protein [Deltaproteobacteria bacterium]